VLTAVFIGPAALISDDVVYGPQKPGLRFCVKAKPASRFMMFPVVFWCAESGDEHETKGTFLRQVLSKFLILCKD